MKPPAPGSKGAQLRALREANYAEALRRPDKVQPKARKPGPQQQETTTMTTTKTKPKAKAPAQPKRQPSTAGRKPSAAPRKAASAPAKRGRYPWTEAAENATRGKLPPPLDFTAACNAPYRAKLAELQVLAKAKDADGLKAVEIPTYNSIVQALGRWRDLAVTAIQAGA